MTAIDREQRRFGSKPSEILARTAFVTKVAEIALRRQIRQFENTDLGTTRCKLPGDEFRMRNTGRVVVRDDDHIAADEERCELGGPIYATASQPCHLPRRQRCTSQRDRVLQRGVRLSRP